MEETRANFRNQESAIRNLETQVGQIARQLSTTLPNVFPSDTQVNPRGECKAVTFEEDNIRELHKQKDEEDSKEKSTKGAQKSEEKPAAESTMQQHTIPFPQQLKKGIK
ncbi:hypothetical protein PIB30_111858, partial [Stylosanthes scabra]|nr:hypothetical protein [Stylosanthes scabra]